MFPQDEFRKYAVKHRGINSMVLHDFQSSMMYGVIEERQLNVAQMDVFSRLMMDRIIFLGTGINDQVANIIQAQLLFLESVDAKKDIQIYLNSPGGGVYAGLGIYDTMQYINCDVATICTGMAASMGAVLLCAGAKGKRSALRHSRVMIHQPMGGAEDLRHDRRTVGAPLEVRFPPSSPERGVWRSEARMQDGGRVDHRPAFTVSFGAFPGYTTL